MSEHRIAWTLHNFEMEQTIIRLRNTRNRLLERIEELQIKINDEVDHLVALKAEIRDVINKVMDIDERMVLRYRYVHNFTWEQIGDELNADKSTIRRWHGNALNHVVVPENPIVIQMLNSNEHF